MALGSNLSFQGPLSAGEGGVLASLRLLVEGLAPAKTLPGHEENLSVGQHVLPGHLQHRDDGGTDRCPLLSPSLSPVEELLPPAGGATQHHQPAVRKSVEEKREEATGRERRRRRDIVRWKQKPVKPGLDPGLDFFTLYLSLAVKL